MQNLVITIVHNLPGRIRLSLTWPPKDIKKLEDDVKKHEGIHSIFYSRITKSVLVYYNPAQIEPTEVIMRLAIFMSVEYDMKKVILSNENKIAGLNKLEYYSLISLIISWTAKGLKLPYDIQSLLNYNSGLSSISAVLYHAWLEIKKCGIYDPEVVSVVYLINSIVKKDFLLASTLTWFIAFGRHLFREQNENVILQAFRTQDKDGNRTYYDVAIKPEVNISNSFTLLKAFMKSVTKFLGITIKEDNVFLMKQIQKVSKVHEYILEGMENKEQQVFLRLEF